MLVPRKQSSHGFYFRFRQWGSVIFKDNYLNTDFILPIAFEEGAYIVICTDVLNGIADGLSVSSTVVYSIEGSSKSRIRLLTQDKYISLCNAVVIGT